MGLFGGSCKRLVKYDGTTFDLSGLVGPGEFKLTLGQLGLKHELLQAATDIVQLYDAMQYTNCTRIQQIPENSPERIKLIHESMEMERQLITFALLTKVLEAQPQNEIVQKGLIDWMASQGPHAQEAASDAQKKTLKSGLHRKDPNVQMPRADEIRSTFEAAVAAEPRLREAMRLGTQFDMDRVLKAI
jgi:hypothetical protein